MHGDRLAAQTDLKGHCRIFEAEFMPWDLYLEEAEDLDTLINNVTNFYHWCAGRVLTLDRQYAKEILNSIGAVQSSTDKDRAEIALSYRCVSLTDIFWVREKGDTATFDEINLYDNHLSNAFVDVSLRGRQMTANNHELARDLSTNGCFPKAWVRQEDGFYLYKDGGQEAVENEILASRICQCFDCNQVIYTEGVYEGEKVSVSRLMTSKDRSIIPISAWQIYAMNQDLNWREEILKLDAYHYHMMNILDYLIGNTDRHWGNWGLLNDNMTNKPISLHPLMDFNRAFQAYTDLDGAGCLPEFPRRVTQREAALEAVKKTGLNQIKEIRKEWFGERQYLFEMLEERRRLLLQ